MFDRASILAVRWGRGYPLAKQDLGLLHREVSRFDATNFAAVSCDVGEECRPICLRMVRP